MTRKQLPHYFVLVVLGATFGCGSAPEPEPAPMPTPERLVPQFEVDPSWPMLPNNWVLGSVASVDVDSRDHVWIYHRPRSVDASQQADAAPAVLEFDAGGAGV